MNEKGIERKALHKDPDIMKVPKSLTFSGSKVYVGWLYFAKFGRGGECSMISSGFSILRGSV
jgi:hypothetical protein